MNSLLYEIYSDQYEVTPKPDEAQREVNKKLSAEWDKIQEALGFDFVDHMMELDAEQAFSKNFQYYQAGFTLGVQLMLEALTSATG